jgi:dolichol-phosphate mannosyltransferase
MNAMGIAVLGEYVTRIYEQVRARPMYLVERRVNFHDEPHEEPHEHGSLSASRRP